MNLKNPLLARSFSILHSSLLMMLIATILEPRIIGAYFPAFLRTPLWGEIAFALLVIPRIYFYSGLYGSLLEILSGEELFFTAAKFNANAKRFWKICLLVTALPWSIHFLVFSFFPGAKVPLQLVTTYGDILFSGILALILVFQKYVQPRQLSRQKIVLLDQDAWVLILLAAANILVYNLPLFFDLSAWKFDRLSILIFRYLHLVTFLFLAQLALRSYPQIDQQFNQRQELYLINPVGGGVFLSVIFALAIRLYPSWFAVLRALTPARYRVREFNRVFWHDRYYASGKLVGISCWTSNSAEAYKIAKEFKRRGSTVVMGGPHVTFLADEALEFCDSVVIGEAEGVWPQVIADYEKKCLKPKYFPQEDPAAFKRVHEFLRDEAPVAVVKDAIETTRGCKYSCYFCSMPGMGWDQLRRKPVPEVVELINKVRPKGRHINFSDNNIYSDPAYTRELLEAIKPLKITWSASSSIDIAQNEAILDLAKASGCQAFLFGYEIAEGSQEQADQGGKLSMAERYISLSRKVQKRKIAIKAHFIIGFDSDNVWSFWNLWKFCVRLRPHFSALTLLTPLPGARFFQDVLAENRILTSNWRNYGCNRLVFQPRRMHRFLLSPPVYAAMFTVLFTTTSWYGLLILFLFLRFLK